MPPIPASHYLVGIDLGTTHTVVAYADAAQGAGVDILVFNIEQLIAPGQVLGRPLLPSVRYHPAPGEMAEADTRLPWSEDFSDTRPVVGELARRLGAKSQGRTITSAKSWLSHAAVDRTAPILPWGAAEGVEKISPVDASASYLAHLRAAWNRQFPDAPLEQQELVVTVPASFDEAARSLTLEAAQLAGLGAVRLLEEPQAACYDWVHTHRQSLAEQLQDVRLLLVVDVGGGTTDLTLIKVEGGADPVLTRIGVGDHLMLGGDNLDLTLANLVEPGLVRERRLSAAELSQVVEQCRAAKETLLGEDAPDTAPVTLLGAGSRMVGATRTAELSQAQVRDIVLDGFFPLTGPDALPERRRSAVVEFGLPYAPDPAISKHIAAFLQQHQQAMREVLGPEAAPLPDAVLLNGGLFRSPAIVRRLLDLLASWNGGRPLKHLRNDRPDLAVAYGAVAYGLARRGLGVKKIGGGSARAYFLVVDLGQPDVRHGVCLLPRGSDEGHEVFLAERSFALRLGQPVRFHLASSVADTHWQPGDLVELDEERFVHLPPLAVAFDRASSQGREEVAVRLAASLTEVGTLKVQCVDAEDSERRWNVEFQLRRQRAAPALQSEGGPHPKAGAAVELIQQVFGKKSREIDPKRIKGLRNELEKMLGKREDWDTPLLRELFSALLEGLPHRRRSDVHERLWLSLTGYCLRPGFGYPLDDWRVEQIWAIYGQGIQYQAEPQNWAEWWTLWRRIAGGLDANAQGTLFAALADFIHPDKAKRGNLPTLAKKHSYEDMLRLAAVLERLPLSDKAELGGWLLRRLGKAGEPAETGWALGRVGARSPFHGGLQSAIPAVLAEEWLSTLLGFDWKKTPTVGFAAALIGRMTGDRERDIAPALRGKLIERLRASKSPESWLGMVAEVKELDAADEKRLFGEALPPGLKLLG